MDDQKPIFKRFQRRRIGALTVFNGTCAFPANLVNYKPGDLIPRSTTGDPALDERADAVFAAWAEQADIGNRAVSDVFEPGSTSKVMTMAAVIEEGAAKATTPFVIPPVLKRPAKTWHDHSPHGTLKLTLNGVLAKSSNIGTIMADRHAAARAKAQQMGLPVRTVHPNGRVVEIDGQPVGAGKPGPVTRNVQKVYYTAIGADVAKAAPWIEP